MEEKLEKEIATEAEKVETEGKDADVDDTKVSSSLMHTLLIFISLQMIV